MTLVNASCTMRNTVMAAWDERNVLFRRTEFNGNVGIPAKTLELPVDGGHNAEIENGRTQTGGNTVGGFDGLVHHVVQIQGCG